MGNSLSPASITGNLATRFIGQRVICFRRLTSTMEVARREARGGTVEGTVVITEEQTAGRGRIRRTWLSPRGNIALSMILYPDAVYLPSLIMLASLAVVHGIEAVTGLRSGIKWPNDVVINGRKVCGILIESDVRGNAVDYAIIGIGINVNLKLSDFPEISLTATSLSDELGRDVSCLDIIRHLLVEVDNLVTLGRQVQVTWGETVYEGVAESVARDGSLLLRQLDGSLTRIVAGDVTLRH